jgi:hypothetical protein
MKFVIACGKKSTHTQVLVLIVIVALLKKASPVPTTPINLKKIKDFKV